MLCGRVPSAFDIEATINTSGRDSTAALGAPLGSLVATPPLRRRVSSAGVGGIVSFELASQTSFANSSLGLFTQTQVG